MSAAPMLTSMSSNNEIQKASDTWMFDVLSSSHSMVPFFAPQFPCQMSTKIPPSSLAAPQASEAKQQNQLLGPSASRSSDDDDWETMMEVFFCHFVPSRLNDILVNCYLFSDNNNGRGRNYPKNGAR